MNAFQACNRVGYFHAFHEARDALRIAGAAADKFHVLDDISVQFKTDFL